MFVKQLKVDMGSVLKTVRIRRGWFSCWRWRRLRAGSETLAAQADGRGSGAHDFDAIDALMQAAVARGSMPGGVVIIGHNGAVVYRKAFGSRSLEPTREAMTADTIFDLASLTKVIATTTAVMQLSTRAASVSTSPSPHICRSLRRTGKGRLRCANC